LKGKNPIPVAPHAGDDPAPGGRLIQSPGQAADGRLPIVAPLPLGIVMPDDQPETPAGTGGGPLQHFEITVGIAKGQDGAPADMLVYADRLASLVVDEIDLALCDFQWVNAIL